MSHRTHSSRVTSVPSSTGAKRGVAFGLSDDVLGERAIEGGSAMIILARWLLYFDSGGEG